MHTHAYFDITHDGLARVNQRNNTPAARCKHVRRVYNAYSSQARPVLFLVRRAFQTCQHTLLRLEISMSGLSIDDVDDVPNQPAKLQAPNARELANADLPSNFVYYAIQSESRFFWLAAAGKLLWSCGIIGINVCLLEITTETKKDTRFQYVMYYTGVALAYAGADILSNYYTAILGSRVMSRLTARIAEHAILKGAPDASERALALSLASRDTQAVWQGLITLFDLAIAPIWFGTVVVLLGIYASRSMPSDKVVQFCAIGACLAISILALMAGISILLTRAKKDINCAESKQVSTFVECLENIRTLRFYGWDNYMLQKLHRMSDEMLPLRLKLLKLKVANIAISFLASPVASMVLLYVYAFTISDTPRSINQPIYFAVLQMFDLIKFPLLLLPNAIRAASGAVASYRRIHAYLNQPAFEDKRQPSATVGLLELLDYPVGPNAVLKSFIVKPASLWILQGPVNSFKVS
jgi:ABC-type multidrug transport system fused ATPase/permease subunit